MKKDEPAQDRVGYWDPDGMGIEREEDCGGGKREKGTTRMVITFVFIRLGAS